MSCDEPAQNKNRNKKSHSQFIQSQIIKTENRGKPMDLNDRKSKTFFE